MIERYLRAQSFPVSRRGFALNFLGDLGQANSLLCINCLLGNLQE